MATTKRQVAAMFTEEKPHLLSLPLEPFRYGSRVSIRNRVRWGVCFQHRKSRQDFVSREGSCRMVMVTRL
jgi:hypothetical protein